MKKTGQGVLQLNKLKSLLAHIPWLIILCLPQTIYADNIINNETTQSINHDRHNHITLIYSEDSTLQSKLAQELVQNITRSEDYIHISVRTSQDKDTLNDFKPGLVIAIGIDSIRTANKKYNQTRKLLIASDPTEYSPDPKSGFDDSVMYMTQPYCRQIQFIKQINKQWGTFSYLSSRKKPVDASSIKQCADKYKITAYRVDVSDEKKLSNDIKEALFHSDLILALPDLTLFNSKSIKNILLTSYRNRKPVIGFSHNLVIAGALASIYSSVEQIAESANALISQYFEQNNHFQKLINYPPSFNISINRQVFRAMDIAIPDVEKLKRVLEQSEADNTGEFK